MRGAGRILGFVSSLLAASTAASETCDRLDVDAVVERVLPALVSYRLDNGLRVHLAPRARDGALSVRIAYDVGSRDEPPGRGGVAHLFEHLMFKGSQHVPDGGVFRSVSAVGGVVNATTDYETTQYWSTLPGAALERTLFIEADRMRALQIGEAKLDNQRAAIREEGLSLENLPYVEGGMRFLERLWQGTPYGHTPLGTPQELAAVTARYAGAFHDTYYAPGNAVLVVAGGFDVERARSAILQSFGSVPTGPSPPPRPGFDVDEQRFREISTDPLAPFPVYAVAWHTAGVAHPDDPAIRVLDDLLMGHPNARLRRRIAEPLTLDAYALPVAFQGVGLLNYVFVPRPSASFDDIESVLQEEVERLVGEAPSAAEVCRSRRQVQRAQLETLLTQEGLAQAIATGVLLQDDPRAFEKRLREVGAVDGASLRRVAGRYLAPGYASLEIQPGGVMRFVKKLLEWLPASVGESLEDALL